MFHYIYTVWNTTIINVTGIILALEMSAAVKLKTKLLFNFYVLYFNVSTKKFTTKIQI